MKSQIQFTNLTENNKNQKTTIETKTGLQQVNHVKKLTLTIATLKYSLPKSIDITAKESDARTHVKRYKS